MSPRDLVGETFIGISGVPRVLRAIIRDYFKRMAINIMPALEIDNFAMAVSLVASTRGVALLPASAVNWCHGRLSPGRSGAADNRCRGRLSQG